MAPSLEFGIRGSHATSRCNCDRVGAEAGLGAMLCRRFAREGYHILAVGRSPDRLSAVVAQIGAIGGSAEAVPADATSEAAVAALFAEAFAPSEIHDTPDLVVFNAGANQPIKFSRAGSTSVRKFLRVGCFAGFLQPLAAHAQDHQANAALRQVGLDRQRSPSTAPTDRVFVTISTSPSRRKVRHWSVECAGRRWNPSR